jgi:serine/threonine protein kinase
MARRKRSLIGARKARPEALPPEVPSEPVTPPAAHVDPLLGCSIGPWVVDEIVGRSQGSCLVRAHHHHSDRIRSSLQVLEDCGADALQRLIHESEVLFPLDHANLPTVRNLNPTHAPPYLELELVRGEPLERVLQRRRALFMAEALDLAEQLLAVLGWLHARGVVHRDVRPGNMLVGKDGVLTLHGFAHALEGRATAPLCHVPDALAYQPPEAPDTGTARADLYAAGAVLYEMLCAQRPFGAPASGCGLTVALVRRLKDDVPFLDPGPRFQEDLRTVVRHLTSREPASRVADAADALARLQAVRRSYA